MAAATPRTSTPVNEVAPCFLPAFWREKFMEGVVVHGSKQATATGTHADGRSRPAGAYKLPNELVPLAQTDAGAIPLAPLLVSDGLNVFS